MVYLKNMSTYINSLTLQGILSFAPDSPPIALNRLNVIIGPNGAGKSNFVDILRFITTIPRGLEHGFRSLGGQSDFFWRGDWRGKDILAQINVSNIMYSPLAEGNSDLAYGISIAPIENEFIITDEKFNVTGNFNVPEYLPNRKKRGNNPKFNKFKVRPIDKTITRVEIKKAFLKSKESIPVESNTTKTSMLMGDIGYYHNDLLEEGQNGETFILEITNRMFEYFLNDNLFLQTWEMGRRAEIRRPQPTDFTISRLMPDYRNLGLILNEIKNRDPELIYAPMRRIIPDFDRLNIDILGGNIAINISERGLKGPTSAFRMSDGTLRFLAILAAIHCKKPPSILVIEEPELALHPDALICLAELLIEASKKTQVFITTHSEVLLSAFRNQLDSVLVCQNRGAGTTMTHLDPNDLALMLETHSLGQIWASGQIGGNP